MFRLIATGEVESIKVGKLRKIRMTQLGRYIDQQRPDNPRPARAPGDSQEADLASDSTPDVHCTCTAHNPDS